MGSSDSLPPISIPQLKDQKDWSGWHQCIKLLATLKGIWKFLNPALHYTDVCVLGRTSDEGGRDYVNSIYESSDEYAYTVKALGELTVLIFNSVDSKSELALEEINRECEVIADGIHLARGVLISLVSEFEPGLLIQAAARQEHAAQKSI